MTGPARQGGSPEALSLEGLARRIGELPGGRRVLVALAGPPGVGKSTLVEELRALLDAKDEGSAAILPMDGYHYDDRVLDARGDRARKGAPHTFDVEGLRAMLARLREERGEIAVPVFDREIEIARAGGRIIDPTVRIVLVEGNYLLLDDPRWRPLHAMFDLTVMLEAPFEEIERRLRRRWTALSGEALRLKMEENDLPNVRLVLERSVPANVRLPNG